MLSYIIPGFYVTKSMKKKGLKESPTLCVKMAFNSQYFINIPSKYRLFTHFGWFFGFGAKFEFSLKK
jgi:hypothetical protein